MSMFGNVRHSSTARNQTFDFVHVIDQILVPWVYVRLHNPIKPAFDVRLCSSTERFD